MTSPLISVIVPVYNVAGYLPRLFSSLMKQKLEDVEIVFIDDGSTDLSPVLLDKFCNQDNLIVRHEANRGVGHARNVGLDSSHGEYLCFIDPDDDISENYLKNLSVVAQTTRADLVLSDWDERHAKSTIAHNIHGLAPNQLLDSEFALQMSLAGVVNGGAVWAKLYSSDLFVENKFPETQSCEDLLPCYRALLKAEKIAYAPQAVYHYTAGRANSLTHLYSIAEIEFAVQMSDKVASAILEKYPWLSAQFRNFSSSSYLSACRKICRSSKVRNKRKSFRKYQVAIRRRLAQLVVDADITIKEKILYLIVSTGYWPTQIALTLWDWRVKGNR